MIGPYFEMVVASTAESATRFPARTFAEPDPETEGHSDAEPLGEEKLPVKAKPPPEADAEAALGDPEDVPELPAETPSKRWTRSAGWISVGPDASCCWRTWAKSCTDSHSFVCDMS